MIDATAGLGQLTGLLPFAETAGTAAGNGATGGTGSPDSASSASSASTGAASSSETGGLLAPNEFLTLLVDSLKYQDPLDPTSTSDFLTQLAELSQVQTQTQISSTDSMAAATALMGQTVGGSDLAGNPLTGVVDGVALTSSGPVLQVGNDSMDLSALSSVGDTPSSPSGSAGGTPDATAGAGDSATPGASGSATGDSASGASGATGSSTAPSSDAGTTS